MEKDVDNIPLIISNIPVHSFPSFGHLFEKKSKDLSNSFQNIENQVKFSLNSRNYVPLTSPEIECFLAILRDFKNLAEDLFPKVTKALLKHFSEFAFEDNGQDSNKLSKKQPAGWLTVQTFEEIWDYILFGMCPSPFQVCKKKHKNERKRKLQKSNISGNPKERQALVKENEKSDGIQVEIELEEGIQTNPEEINQNNQTGFTEKQQQQMRDVEDVFKNLMHVLTKIFTLNAILNETLRAIDENMIENLEKQYLASFFIFSTNFLHFLSKFQQILEKKMKDPNENNLNGTRFWVALLQKYFLEDPLTDLITKIEGDDGSLKDFFSNLKMMISWMQISPIFSQKTSSQDKKKKNRRNEIGLSLDYNKRQSEMEDNNFSLIVDFQMDDDKIPQKKAQETVYFKKENQFLAKLIFNAENDQNSAEEGNIMIHMFMNFFFAEKHFEKPIFAHFMDFFHKFFLDWAISFSKTRKLLGLEDEITTKRLITKMFEFFTKIHNFNAEKTMKLQTIETKKENFLKINQKKPKRKSKKQADELGDTPEEPTDEEIKFLQENSWTQHKNSNILSKFFEVCTSNSEDFFKILPKSSKSHQSPDESNTFVEKMAELFSNNSNILNFEKNCMILMENFNIGLSSLSNRNSSAQPDVSNEKENLDISLNVASNFNFYQNNSDFFLGRTLNEKKQHEEYPKILQKFKEFVNLRLYILSILLNWNKNLRNVYKSSKQLEQFFSKHEKLRQNDQKSEISGNGTVFCFKKNEKQEFFMFLVDDFNCAIREMVHLQIEMLVSLKIDISLPASLQNPEILSNLDVFYSTPAHGSELLGYLSSTKQKFAILSKELELLHTELEFFSTFVTISASLLSENAKTSSKSQKSSEFEVKFMQNSSSFDFVDNFSYCMNILIRFLTELRSDLTKPQNPFSKDCSKPNSLIKKLLNPQKPLNLSKKTSFAGYTNFTPSPIPAHHILNLHQLSPHPKRVSSSPNASTRRTPLEKRFSNLDESLNTSNSRLEENLISVSQNYNSLQIQDESDANISQISDCNSYDVDLTSTNQENPRKTEVLDLVVKKNDKIKDQLILEAENNDKTLLDGIGEDDEDDDEALIDVLEKLSEAMSEYKQICEKAEDLILLCREIVRRFLKLLFFLKQGSKIGEEFFKKCHQVCSFLEVSDQKQISKQKFDPHSFVIAGGAKSMVSVKSTL